MQQGQVRIIAGKWRGRKLQVPDIKDLRPTPDRVRETLFNWLAPMIAGAHCLDVFAGSGALGFEALSRGAAHVVMVDQARVVVELLKAELVQFGANNAEVYQAKVPEQLQKPRHPFDIVFLDPPYQSNLLLPCCHYLEGQGFLADSAYLYLEASEVIKDNELPKNWRLIKTRQAGQVAYHLAQREKAHHD
ncbi:16S rRNA (guanine(966)-N(2))-methyltransferase RsmD [Aquicella lusitana]|uniref:Ribosomal RNA small subunit methyltransferase D n=1 Tax=Aquicella lusitana TaxID=254246 RepID=A0A370G192_9COXI|nr:16S rRNA (guanine(966)-N(2))-methyltransferase RsmD [Aquicella lusitana]RDI37512.1 16S rRNA m(2)G-966 methyltransferase [Aquicella lusitana]VVC72624.1 Ribosomal RNA small subunit methyltransferase D [Aquicella lusitana]